MKTLIAIALLLLIGCNGVTNTKQMNTLPDVVQVGQSPLSRDTIAPVKYQELTTAQCATLAKQSGLDVPDSTCLIGVRDIDGTHSLAAYKAPRGEDPNDFKVYLMTHTGSGEVIDALDLGPFHVSESQLPLRFGGNRFYTLDSSLTFDGERNFVVHRAMTLTSLYLKNHQLTEMWRAGWDDQYEISKDGHFIFKSQQETYRTEGIDDPMIEEFKSRTRPSN